MIRSYLNEINDKYVYPWLVGRAKSTLEQINLDKIDPIDRKMIKDLLNDIISTKKYFEEKNNATNSNLC